MKHHFSIFALAAVLLVSPATGFAESNEKKAPVTKDTLHDSVAEMVKKGFNSFVAALTKSDYLEKVATGAYTVLAPNDVAFSKMPKEQLDALLADKEKLNAMLSQHIIEGKVSSSDLKSGKKTLAGTSVKAKVVDGKLKVGTATLVRLDLPSSNGVIHGLDGFLQP